MTHLPLDQAPLLHGETTSTILACAMEVSNELGTGFLEATYERALAICLAEAGLLVELQKPLTITFRHHIIGTFHPDMVIESCVLVELKAVRALVPDHEAQVIHYLTASGIEVVLLLNFGNSRLEYRRMTRRKSFDVFGPKTNPT